MTSRATSSEPTVSSAPKLRVYGAELSYFTGKLEAYLRYKEIPYDYTAMTATYSNRIIPQKTGVMQMPAVELPPDGVRGGEWLTDSTPIIEWLEGQFPTPVVIPKDPVQSFFSRLIEDYADEWLWRPAMHYRWSYPADRRLLSDLLVGELGESVPLPHWLKRRAIEYRQLTRFVKRDGVSHATREHVEGGYLRALDNLQAIFSLRPFLLGDVPTLADFGFMGPMFRHFGHDPTPLRIMRNRAPAVWEWLARCWNATASDTRGELLTGVPEDWAPMLDEACATHLEQLAGNAAAWQAGLKVYDLRIQGVVYRDLPTSAYRVWCLERLRSHFRALPQEVQPSVQQRLEDHAGWEPLWRMKDLASGHDPEGTAPFCRGTKVFPF